MAKKTERKYAPKKGYRISAEEAQAIGKAHEELGAVSTAEFAAYCEGDRGLVHAAYARRLKYIKDSAPEAAAKYLLSSFTVIEIEIVNGKEKRTSMPAVVNLEIVERGEADETPTRAFTPKQVKADVDLMAQAEEQFLTDVGGEMRNFAAQFGKARMLGLVRQLVEQFK